MSSHHPSHQSDVLPTIAAYMNPDFLNRPDPWVEANTRGFQMVEIPGCHFDPFDEANSATDLAGALRDNGLSARWHCSPGFNQQFGSEDSSLRQANLDRMRRELDWVHEMGWNMFILHSGRGETADERARARESLQKLNETAKRLGIDLLLENGSSRFNGDPEELIATCETVPGLGITFDCSHAHRSVFCKEGKGSVADHLDLVRPYVRSFQFNDFDGSTNCAVGRGELPWDQLMPMAIDLDCEVWAIEVATIEETIATRDFLDSW